MAFLGLCHTGVVTIVTQPASDLIFGANQVRVVNCLS